MNRSSLVKKVWFNIGKKGQSRDRSVECFKKSRCDGCRGQTEVQSKVASLHWNGLHIKISDWPDSLGKSLQSFHPGVTSWDSNFRMTIFLSQHMKDFLEMQELMGCKGGSTCKVFAYKWWPRVQISRPTQKSAGCGLPSGIHGRQRQDSPEQGATYLFKMSIHPRNLRVLVRELASLCKWRRLKEDAEGNFWSLYAYVQMCSCLPTYTQK